MKDKVTVLGGSGFLGSHIADELERRGFDVTIFDESKSPWSTNSQVMRVGNLLTVDDLQDACRGSRFIYHCAGVADIAAAMQDPFGTIQTNVMGTASVLEVARQEKVERLVYASTMYVYSASGSFYRASKQASEALIEAYGESFGLGYSLLRFGSLYGPRSQEWNGLRGYVRQVMQTGSLQYPGSGQERREYIHVVDAARLSVDILDERHRNQAITVTGTQVMTSSELAEMIFEIVGQPTNVSFSDQDRTSEHYRVTPYRFSPKRAKKLVPEEFIDLGQGILELCEEVANESNQ
jgi:UDP-glucose 4-epimerase